MSKMTEEIKRVESDGEITIKWNSKKFFTRPQRHGFYIDSPEFLLSDAKWYLRIYPDGDVPENYNWASLYLRRSSSSGEFTGRISFRIETYSRWTFHSADTECSVKDAEQYGKPKFILSSILFNARKRVSMDDSLTVIFTARPRPTPSKPTNSVVNASCQTSFSQVGDNLAKDLKDLLLSGYHSDIKIKVQGQEIQAHRSILAARSSVLRSMLDHEMLEKTSGVINIDDCDAETVQNLLLYIYTGKIDHVTSGNAPSLYRIADKYNVMELKQECAHCMDKEVSVDSFCDIILLSAIYSEGELLNNAKKFFIRNWTEIISTVKWQSFLAENHSVANELLIELAKQNKM